MDGISIGKYVHGNSFAYKVDPRIKLLINIIFIVLVFLTKNFIVLGIILVPAIIFYLLTPLRKNQLIKMMLPIIFIGFFIFLINMFVLGKNEASDELFNHVKWWKITISDTTVLRTLILMLRIYIMVIVTTLLISTTKPTALTRSIEDLLSPLKLIKIPVHIIAMIISIALRFIPTLLSESQRIMKAQASRGVDFKNGNFKAKIKSLSTLIIPLFVSAFAKAEDLGNAMEVRGYDPYAKRVRYRSYSLSWRDLIVSLIVIGLIAIIALMHQDILILPINNLVK